MNSTTRWTMQDLGKRPGEGYKRVVTMIIDIEIPVAELHASGVPAMTDWQLMQRAVEESLVTQLTRIRELEPTGFGWWDLIRGDRHE